MTTEKGKHYLIWSSVFLNNPRKLFGTEICLKNFSESIYFKERLDVVLRDMV